MNGFARSEFLGILFAIVFAALLSLYSQDFEPRASGVSRPPLATSTLAVISEVTLPPLVLPEVFTEEVKEEAVAPPAPVTKAPVPLKAPARPSQPKPAPESAAVVATPAAEPITSSGDSDIDASAAALRAAVVNIYCVTPSGSGLHSISGSGVFVDPKGIIITNAHIAQYFLLTERGVKCSIRYGSPAKEMYTAALIYISPKWLRANPTVLTTENPVGTGEYDFAFVAVAGAKSGSMPTSFPYVPLASSPPKTGVPVVIATYGAQFLQSDQIRSQLYPTVVFGSVKEIFTFGRNTADVLALGGSVAAQEGSSGGGVAGGAGTLLGIITTSTTEGETATRQLDAISSSYIRGQVASETGNPLEFLLSDPPSQSVAEFSEFIPELASIITAQLP